MGAVLELIDRGRQIAAEGRAHADAQDLYLWDSLDRALELGTEYQDALEDLGTDGLQDLAASLTTSAPLEARLQLIAGASSFAELTADALADVSVLDADRLRRREIRERRLEFAFKVGEVGLRLLMKFIMV